MFVMNQRLLLAALPGALLAQSLEGTWQGTMAPSNQSDGIRLAFKIDKNGNTYQGTFYNLANGRQLNLGAITLQGNAVKIAIPGNGMNYEGKIEADRNSINGSLNQGENPSPLQLKRATSETAWELPPPPTARGHLPESTKAEFEAASIKPSPEGQPGNGGFNVTATELFSRNTSLADIITFAFELHLTQVSGLAGWAETEAYDIAARLPQGGEPSDAQLRTMLKNLLQSRFGLSFHTEKREMSVYAIRMGKNGPAGIKMVKNTTNGARIGSQGLGRVSFSGITMAGFAGQLQLRVLDRPVIDQTGLTDRYDFTLNWRPDEFQFPRATAAQRAYAVVNGADALPDLFAAFQEQLGMKLEATKALAEALVIDKVAKPSEN
jgi:uncharacterized protein (TIGR03435 family)